MSSQQSLQTISEIKDAVYYLLDRLNALSLQVSERREAIINNMTDDEIMGAIIDEPGEEVIIKY